METTPRRHLYTLCVLTTHRMAVPALHPSEAYGNLPPIRFQRCVNCIINLWTKHALWLLPADDCKRYTIWHPFASASYNILNTELTILRAKKSPQHPKEWENTTSQIQSQDSCISICPRCTSPCQCTFTQVVKNVAEIVCILYLYHPCHIACSAWLDCLKMSLFVVHTHVAVVLIAETHCSYLPPLVAQPSEWKMSSRLSFFIATLSFFGRKLLKSDLWIWCPLLRELGYVDFQNMFLPSSFLSSSLCPSCTVAA